MPMQNAMDTTLNGKTFEVRLTPSAERALQALPRPLLVEMELYFSCLIRKQLRIHTDQAPKDGDTRVGDKLCLRFRPVMSEACHGSIHDGPPPLTDFPIANDGFSPRWLELDYKSGEWQGEYGWNTDKS